MGGGGTTQTTQTSGLNNPQLNTAVSTIGSQLNTQLGNGVKPYTESMVPALSGQTTAGIGALTNNPNTSIFSGGVSGALGQQAQIAQGNFGNDPMFDILANKTKQNVNSSFLTDGRFGSIGDGAHSGTLATETANALAPYAMARQQQGIQNLGTLYSMSNMPAAANLQAGQIMDTYNTAKAQDAARIFDATQNAGWNTLQRGASVLAGTAPAAGTTTTNTQPAAPWWQGILGLGMQAF